jgi:signal transduction histidine kinase
VEFSTLVQFSKLVSDSSTTGGIFVLLGQTVVEQCGALHAVVFGTAEGGDFAVLSSYGNCTAGDLDKLDLTGVDSVAELQVAVMDACAGRGYGFRAFPLISDAGLFGALIVLYSQSHPLTERHWILIEGLTELTAISLNKAHQHYKLQKAFDDLRVSQDALIRTEKFRALGEMSAGIAHDLKNLLNPLLLYTDHIRDMAGNREEVLEAADRIDRILTRGLETVERLRDFSRQSSDEAESVPANLNSLVQEAVEISKPRIGRIPLVQKLGQPPFVLLRPSDCVTAIVNLLLNAADALSGKGTITVTTGNSSGGAWVQVEDDGPGMPPEIKNRILEPFFTTKGEVGTGLGLSIVYAFTQRHGGRLEVDSEPGKGSKFRMWFPG